MQRNLLQAVERYGNLPRVTDLIASGFSHRTIDRAVRSGSLLRICRGWVATREASRSSVTAVLHRGILAGPSALASYGTWDGVATRLHVQRKPNAHGAPRPATHPLTTFRSPLYLPSHVLTRWREDVSPDPDGQPWRQSVIDALLYVAKYGSYEQFIACVDSALHEGTLSAAGLPRLTSLLPERLRHYEADLDSGAGSGLESLSRLRLRSVARTIESQVTIPGISRGGGDGQIDLLLNKWLAFEADGDSFHDPVVDRRRNQLIVERGMRSHRFGYDQIVNHWPLVEATVRELLRYPPPGRG